MNKFVEIPANKHSLLLRKPVFGVGINDAEYVTRRPNSVCPFYRRWQDMLKRCYSDKFHITRPTYIDCSVSSEWVIFSNFKDWMKRQDWEGMQLDKDIISPGNKIYSDEFCVFIPVSLNNLLGDHAAARGGCSQGVNFNKNSGKYHAYCNENGKRRHLGLFVSEEEASRAYREFKSRYVIEVAQEHKRNARLYRGLIRHAKLILIG